MKPLFSIIFVLFTLLGAGQQKGVVFKIATEGGCVPTTPSAPTLSADDNLNTLSASHALGTSEILVSVNNGAYSAYSGVINVGNVARPQGYWKFKIKSASCRNESAVVESPAFTYTPTNPGAYNQYMIDWLEYAGLTDSTEVLYDGTDQEITVQGVKDLFNPFFDYAQRVGLIGSANAMAAFYPAIGETWDAAKVNAFNPGTYDLTAPNSITVNRFGLQGNGVNQYVLTGINPINDFFHTEYVEGVPTNNVNNYDDDSVRGYLAIYSNGTQAYVRSYNSSSTSWRLESHSNLAYYDHYGELGNNRIITSISGAVGLLQGNRMNKDSFALYRNGTLLGETKERPTGTANFPSAEIQLGANENTEPFCLVLISAFGYEDEIIDSINYYLIQIAEGLNRDEVAPVTAQPPSNLTVYDSLKIMRFTVSNGNTEMSHYGISTDGGESYTPLSSANTREVITITGASYSPKQYDIYFGNVELAASDIKLKVLNRSGVIESAAVSPSTGISFDAAWQQWRPAYLTYESSTGEGNNAYYQTINWIDPFGIDQTEYFRYQVTYDGGSTWQRCPMKPTYLDNRSYDPNLFGVRTVIVNQEDILEDISRDSVISDAVYYASAIVAQARDTVNVRGLRQFDATVTASTTAGSYVVTLSNNNYQLKIGDRLIIASNTTPGMGMRGTQGLKSWPLRIEPDSATAMANISSYIANEYFGNLTDSGYVYRWNSDRTGFSRFWESDPNKNKIISRPLEGVITALSPDGLTVTLDDSADLSVTGAAVYFDNGPLLNKYSTDTITHHSVVNIPAGEYPISGRWAINKKFDVNINAFGVTLYSPAGVRSASFTTEGCHGLKINQTSGTGYFSIIGNYAYHTMGFMWGKRDDDYNQEMYPTIDQAFTNYVTVLNPNIGLWAGYVRADSLFAKNGPHAYIQGGSDFRYRGIYLKRDSALAFSGSGSVPYFGGYWKFNIEGAKGGVCDGLRIEDVKWGNGFEVFNCVGTVVRNVYGRNVHNSMNGSAKCLYQDVRVDLDSGIRTFHNAGFPVFENNVFHKNHSWSYKNRLHRVVINLAGSIIDGTPDIYPVGVWDRGGVTMSGGVKSTHGFEVINFEYHRPHLTTSPPWPAQAIRISGDGGLVDSATVTGNWTTEQISGGVSFWGGSSIAVGDINCDNNATPVLKNISAPTLSYPASTSVTNVTATQGIVSETLFVCAGTDTTISGSSFTFQPTVETPSGVTVTQSEWIFKGATYNDGSTMPYSGTSTSTIAIPTSFPQSISLTTQANLLMPVGANVYLYNASSGKQIEAKITAYNSSTGALTVSATTAGGATGTYSEWEVISEPVITNIYELNATVSGLLAGRYVYELKITPSSGSVVRDSMAITKE